MGMHSAWTECRMRQGIASASRLLLHDMCNQHDRRKETHGLDIPEPPPTSSYQFQLHLSPPTGKTLNPLVLKADTVLHTWRWFQTVERMELSNQLWFQQTYH